MTAAAGADRVLDVDTPHGPARAHLHEPRRGAVRATVVLGHGAGGGIEARDLQALALALPGGGARVVLVEQPWRVAGKKVAPAPATLDVGWLAVLDRLAADGVIEGSLVVGGRSAGARVACRTALTTGAAAAVLLAFPLHPPGRPEKTRTGELLEAGVPLHVVQGARDPFGGPDELAAAVLGLRITAIPAADHGMKVPKAGPVTQEEALGLVVDGVRSALAEWVPGGRR